MRPICNEGNNGNGVKFVKHDTALNLEFIWCWRRNERHDGIHCWPLQSLIV